jgi:3,4-dihydroxy 2-butanone 4-phosphate synthase/GTP cyclohydrolase II
MFPVPSPGTNSEYLGCYQNGLNPVKELTPEGGIASVFGLCYDDGPLMKSYASVTELLAELRRGHLIVLVDDKDRENEGDLVVAAEHATPESINFMAKIGRGLICLALNRERCEQLHLNQMVDAKTNNSKFGTAFTVTVDAAKGISSGTSAYDRSLTIRTVISDACGPEDLVRPGHIFPIMARPGGVLVRAGHTEGAVDLARLAGLKPAAVICEIMNERGEMARGAELVRIAQKHHLKMGSIADLIEYRRRTERLVERVASATLPTRHGPFKVHLYRSIIDDYQHLALCAGDVGEERGGKTLVQAKPVLVRVHSECLTGDIFGSRRCDCGEQLDGALQRIQEEGRGCLLYIRQEGRGIGLENKLKAYALQEQGLDTVEANRKLGLPADLRHYGIGAQILYDLGIRSMKLLTNNPKKIFGIEGFGLKVVEQVPIEVKPNPHNHAYLKTKKRKLGHLLKLK